MKNIPKPLLKQSAAAIGFNATAIGALAFLAASTSSQAVPQPAPISLSTNQQVIADASINTGFLGGTPFSAGTNPLTVTSTIFDITGGTNIGTIKEWVYTNATTHNLDFYYQVTLDPSDTAGVTQVVIRGLTQPGLQLSVFTDLAETGLPGAHINGSDIAPTTFQTSAPSTLDINFASAEIFAGQSSVIFGYQSNQQFVANGDVRLTDGGISAATLLVPVPEPTATLFGVAILGIVCVTAMKRLPALRTPRMVS